jgi:hypothetical protein
MTIKYELIHADTCLSCYWSGHHLATIQIPVWPGMSLQDIKDGLHSEIAQGAIGGNLPDELAYNEYELNDHGYAVFKAAIDAIEPAVPGTDSFFNDIEEPDPDDEFIESVYAFFVLREI